MTSSWFLARGLSLQHRNPWSRRAVILRTATEQLCVPHTCLLLLKSWLMAEEETWAPPLPHIPSFSTQDTKVTRDTDQDSSGCVTCPHTHRQEGVIGVWVPLFVSSAGVFIKVSSAKYWFHKMLWGREFSGQVNLGNSISCFCVVSIG